MKRNIHRYLSMGALGLSLFLFSAPCQAGEDIDVCGLVNAQQLAGLYRKPLHPTAQGNGCFWSLQPGAMAYLHIGVHDRTRQLREYFNKELSPSVKLEAIADLGDEGLMTVSEGSLGVVVIRKGNRVLQSAVTFLDIEPGSKQQQLLWEVYRSVLARM